MRRLAGALGALALLSLASSARADAADPIGDLIARTLAVVTMPGTARAATTWRARTNMT